MQYCQMCNKEKKNKAEFKVRGVENGQTKEVCVCKDDLAFMRTEQFSAVMRISSIVPIFVAVHS